MNYREVMLHLDYYAKDTSYNNVMVAAIRIEKSPKNMVMDFMMGEIPNGFYRDKGGRTFNKEIGLSDFIGDDWELYRVYKNQSFIENLGNPSLINYTFSRIKELDEIYTGY